MEKLEKKLDELLESVTKAQKRVDEVGTKADKNDGEYKAMAEKATKALEEIVAIQKQMKAVEDMQKILEKQSFRDAAGSDSAVKEANKKAKTEFTKFLRKGIALTPETVEYIANEIVESKYIGISDEQKAVEKKSLIAGVNPQGGYFIRPELSAKTIKRVYETSPMRDLADVVTTSADILEMIIDDGESTIGGAVGETGTRSATATPDIGKLSIEVHEIYGIQYASQRILDNEGFDVESWLLAKMADKMARTENTQFISGTGNKECRGILSLSAWTTDGTYEKGKIEQIESGTAGEVTADGLINTQNALIEDYQANATWLMKRATFGSCLKLKDGQGNYLVNTRLLSEGANKVLLGNPVRFANDMAAVASAALAIAYGDFKVGYTIVDKVGIRVVRDEYTAVPYIKFYGIKFTGGDVTSYDAIKLNILSA